MFFLEEAFQHGRGALLVDWWGGSGGALGFGCRSLLCALMFGMKMMVCRARVGVVFWVGLSVERGRRGGLGVLDCLSGVSGVFRVLVGLLGVWFLAVCLRSGGI